MQLDLFAEGTKTDKAVLFNLLDGMPDGYKFKGIFLQEEVLRITGHIHYPDSLLRYMREYRKKRGRAIVNVDKKHSLYEVMGNK